MTTTDWSPPLTIPFDSPHCSTTGANGPWVKSHALLDHRRYLAWWLVALVLLSVDPGGGWRAAAQALPCTPGSAPSGSGGSCVSCAAGLFCPDGWALPLPCPPGSVVFLTFYVTTFVLFDYFFNVLFPSSVLFHLQDFIAPPAWCFQ